MGIKLKQMKLPLRTLAQNVELMMVNHYLSMQIIQNLIAGAMKCGYKYWAVPRR